MTQFFRSTALSLLLCAGLLTACDSVPDWLGGSPKPIVRAPGERVNVISSLDGLKPDAAAQEVAVELPEQVNLEEWRSVNDAMPTGHVGLTGVGNDESVSIGNGHGYQRSVVPPPVVASGMIFAMDAAGVVSAHREADISDVLWTNDRGRPKKRVSDVLGGGLSYADHMLYATTGMGNLQAIEASSGATKWSVSVGAPVRGAPTVGGGLVIVLTADNQTLAYDIATGQPRWEHRGIRETAGYFSITSPVVREGVVVAAYSSGEVFVLRLETGAVLWSDSLSGGVRTKASSTFGGIDANPIAQEGVLIVTSTSGLMQASVLANGRPLWQTRVGAYNTPWSAGNVIFVLTDTHDIAAILKRDGTVRWANSLAVRDARDPSKDKTPPLYGPILSANAVLVIDGNGVLTSFKPTTGEKIGSYELTEGIVSSPVIANGAMYVVTRDAKLWKYY